MFPLHYFVLCFLCLMESTAWIDPLNLQNTVLGKQAMQRAELHKFLETQRTNVCAIVRPERQGNEADYKIDFGETYPVTLINMTIYSKIQMTDKVRVFIDSTLCKSNLQNGSNVFTCSQFLSGRILSVKSFLSVSVCSVQVFTCSAGMQGSDCKKNCSNGTYGVACRPCNCENNEVCQIYDGLCLSGCLGQKYGQISDCYYKSISSRYNEHFVSYTDEDIKRVFFSSPSIRRKNVFRNEDGSFFVGKLNCTVFTSAIRNESVMLVLSYRETIIVYSVLITYCILDISPPFSIHITLDGYSCYGTTNYSPLAVGTYEFTCQRKGRSGRTLTIRHTSYNFTSTTATSIGLSEVRVMECADGFYGTKCRLHCHCLGSVCDHVTGYCPSRMCGDLARGRNCAAINIAPPAILSANINNQLAIERASGDPDSLVLSLRRAAFDSSLNMWTSWWAAQLDGVYRIQGVTLGIQESHLAYFRTFSVFLDTDVSLENYLPQNRTFWTGPGCKRDSQQQLETTIDVICAGPTRIITVVTYSNSPFLSASVQDIEIWACEDGTFGPRCENICNCEDEEEVCNKVTGECLSGCTDGYGGMDCMSPCLAESKDRSCWKDCRCREISKGCGPGVMLCEECLPGWLGVTCNIPCPHGWYGLACSEQCGPCKNDARRKSCDPINGTCYNGCTNKMTTSTCKIDNNIDKVFETIAFSDETVTTIKIVFYGLVITVLVGALIWLCVRLFKLKHADPLDVMKRTRTASEHKAGDEDINVKIMLEHHDYHEKFVHNKVLQQDIHPPTQQKATIMSNLFSFFRPKEDKEKTTNRLWGTKNTQKEKPSGTDRCTPMENNTQQNADQKVAHWILREDFDALIQRRQDRLDNYTGDILNIKESTYSLTSVNMTKEELDKLYDEAQHLSIP